MRRPDISIRRSARGRFFLSLESLVAASLAVPLFLGGCARKPAARVDAVRVISVKTRIARFVPIPDTSEYLATLKSRRSASINPQVEGWVTRIFVHSGDHVRAEAPLMEIDPRVQQAALNSQEAALKSQQANLANSQAQFLRAKKLYDAGIVSKQDYDTYKTAYDSALATAKSMEAQVRQQQVQLRYYTVVAPSEGIVGDIPVHVGDRVTNTTLLTTVNQIGRLEAYIYVPVDHARQLRIGDPVDLLDASGKIIARSKIYFVSPQVDNTTQSILAKAEIGNPGDKLRNEQFVTARITWRTAPGLLIPVLAVSRINGQFFAFFAEKTAKGTIARERLIQVGNIYGNDYVVQSGMKPGDHVIVAGFQFLADGTRIKETVEGANPTAPAASH